MGTVVSFGFKYGLPSDADERGRHALLAEPVLGAELRNQSGLDEPVREYVLGADGALEFLDTYAAALAPVLEGYRRENKRHATIAVGCTGGKHRSVAIAEELGRRLRELPGVTVNVRHRDLGRE